MNDGQINEPDDSTVDDWHGQNVARDQDVADKALQENDTAEEAERQFDQEAVGEEKYQAGHDRPDDVEADGDVVGRATE